LLSWLIPYVPKVIHPASSTDTPWPLNTQTKALGLIIKPLRAQKKQHTRLPHHNLPLLLLLGVTAAAVAAAAVKFG
jgi:hypothetical protein